MKRAVKQVQCRICGLGFRRFATQPEGKRGWLCSHDCRRQATLQDRGANCVGCGARFYPPSQSGFCGNDCRLHAMRAASAKTCKNCGQSFTGKNGIYCGKECWRQHCRKCAKCWGECAWCGKECRLDQRWRGDRGGGRYCSLHCKQSVNGLRDWVRQKLKHVRRRAAVADSSGQRDGWGEAIRAIISKHRWQTREATQAAKWRMRCGIMATMNRYRQTKPKAQCDNEGEMIGTVESEGATWDSVCLALIRKTSKKYRNSTASQWLRVLHNKTKNVKQRMIRKAERLRQQACTPE